MPSSINSTSSSPGGLISSGDTDNELEIKTGDTTAISIDASQNVTVAGDLTVSGTVSGTVDVDTVTGTLDVANGGTGATTLTANNVILGNGTSAVSFVAPGSNGNVLTSNGTTWTSAAAAGGGGDYIMRTYNSPATWSKPTGLKAVKVTVTGGGSGSAIAPSSATAGGTSSFGPFLSATGGFASVPNASCPIVAKAGYGGLGSGGDVNMRGGMGSQGIPNAITFNPSTPATLTVVNGGASFFGYAGIPPGRGAQTGSIGSGGSTGQASTGGGGGGGGTAIEYIPAPSIPGPVSVTVGAGGAGASPAPVAIQVMAGEGGVVIVEEFY